MFSLQQKGGTTEEARVPMYYVNCIYPCMMRVSRVEMPVVRLISQ